MYILTTPEKKPSVPKANSDAMDVDTGESGDTKLLKVHSDKIANRGIYVYAHYCDFSLKTGKWNRKSGKILYMRNLASKPRAHMVRFIFTKCGKQFAVNRPRCVPMEKLEPAWATTIDSYQGNQRQVIIVALPSSGLFTSARKRDELCKSVQNPGSSFGRNHLHVAFSRARFRVIVMGTEAEVKRLAMRDASARFTLLEHTVHTHFNPQPVQVVAPGAKRRARAPETKDDAMDYKFHTTTSFYAGDGDTMSLAVSM